MDSATCTLGWVLFAPTNVSDFVITVGPRLSEYLCATSMLKVFRLELGDIEICLSVLVTSSLSRYTGI